MPKPAFPSPAATLPGEADVLANVLADLSDHDAKLVYADWLEERDDTRGPLLREFVTAHRAGKKLPAVKSAPRPWCDLVGITIMTRIRGTALAPKADQLLALPLPAISFRSTRAADARLPVGVSKLGGHPDLPVKTRWPKDGRQLLAFVGQFNCADLRASPAGRELPDKGLLSLFAAWDEDNWFELPDSEEERPLAKMESWRLFYFSDTAELVRRAPGAKRSGAASFRSCRLEFTEALTLPGWIAPMRELGARGGDDVCKAYHTLFAEMYFGDHLFGHQTYDRAYGRLDDATAKQRPRRLLTLWSNDRAGWSCDDDGAFYITLGQDDLRKKRFHRARIGSHGC